MTLRHTTSAACDAALRERDGNSGGGGSTARRVALGAGIAGGALLLANTTKIVRWLRRADLRGQSTLIMGGSRGLGLELAREFGWQGARVTICARDEQELTAARDQLARDGVDVRIERCDLTRRDEVERTVARVTERDGRVDILVNVAAVISVGPYLDQTLDDFEQVMVNNFWGPVYAVLAVLPQMLARHAGRIVTIDSLGGKVVLPHIMPYCCSKFALYAYSTGLCAELAREGIIVTTVCPGLMRTGSFLNIVVKGQHRKEYTAFSLMDSLPLITIDAHRAARQIVGAARRGDPELIVTNFADLLCKLQGLAPGTTTAIMRTIGRLLPGAIGADGKVRRIGSQCETAVSQSFLTALGRDAAQHLNQEIAAHHPEHELDEFSSEPMLSEV